MRISRIHTVLIPIPGKYMSKKYLIQPPAFLRRYQKSEDMNDFRTVLSSGMQKRVKEFLNSKWLILLCGKKPWLWKIRAKWVFQSAPKDLFIL